MGWYTWSKTLWHRGSPRVVVVYQNLGRPDLGGEVNARFVNLDKLERCFVNLLTH